MFTPLLGTQYPVGLSSSCWVMWEVWEPLETPSLGRLNGHRPKLSLFLLVMMRMGQSKSKGNLLVGILAVPPPHLQC